MLNCTTGFGAATAAAPATVRAAAHRPTADVGSGAISSVAVTGFTAALPATCSAAESTRCCITWTC